MMMSKMQNYITLKGVYMPTRGLKAFWVKIPYQAMLEALRSPVTLTCPRGYNPLEQSLEFI